MGRNRYGTLLQPESWGINSLVMWSWTMAECDCQRAFSPIKQYSNYLLTSETRAAKGFSQAYILMIRIPETTSFMMRILLSVCAAVLLLRK